jgi:hypothetical protein
LFYKRIEKLLPEINKEFKGMIWTLEKQTTNIEVQEKNTSGSKHGGRG